MLKKKIIYITETSLPSSSANIINSLKFSDALAKYYNITFLLPFSKLNRNKIKKNYKLKNDINYKNVLNKKLSSKLDKFFFCLKIIIYLKFENHKSTFILSRSILCSIFLAFFNIKNTLEIHHNLNSITKMFFNILIKSYKKKNISFILINKSLITELNIQKFKYIVLDDAADNYSTENKGKYTKNKILKNTCVYMGSFFQGKGIEIIIEIAKLMRNIEFHLYGEKSVLKKRKIKISYGNIKLKGKISYNQVSKILKKYDIALMPYQDKILGRSKNLEISKYISPLKMFDYLSAGNIILASKLKAYDHILKNNVNAFTINNKKIKLWKNLINKIFTNPKKYKYIKINAITTAKKYSWNNRALNFVNFIENKLN